MHKKKKISISNMTFNRLIKTSFSNKGKANLKHRASYSYDYRGLLVQKNYHDYDLSNYIQLDNPSSSKEITEYYEYTLDGRVIYNERKDNSIVNKTDYIWANTTLWCEVTKNDVYYHHTDHLGTTEVITDSNGNIVWHADYEAFGSVMNERGDENFTPNYTGKFFDESSGLYYFNARWYDCELGRFTSQDPARDGVNWWIYCGGNPITMKDPTGMSIDDWQDNGDGTWTVKSEGAKLWDVWGTDSYDVTGLTEEEARNIHVGDTFGKKNTLTNTNSSSENNQQNSQGNAQNANGLNAISVEKKQSTLSSWWSKKAGENLTDEEKNLQKGIGIGEMIAGPTLGTLGCAQTGGQSVLYGYYVMADGAVMVAKAEEGVKAIPGAFFLNLLCPVTGTANGVPVVVEYNMSALPAGRYR